MDRCQDDSSRTPAISELVWSLPGEREPIRLTFFKLCLLFGRGACLDVLVSRFKRPIGTVRVAYPLPRVLIGR